LSPYNVTGAPSIETTSIMPPPVDNATRRCSTPPFCRVRRYVLGCGSCNVAMRISSWMPAARRAAADSGKRASSASQPSSPPNKPMSEPWLSCVVASDPSVSNSMSTVSGSPPHRSRASRPMRTEAAECELDGPRMTGPTTSLKMLGGRVVGITELARISGTRTRALARRRVRRSQNRCRVDRRDQRGRRCWQPESGLRDRGTSRPR
jgi:hypothetical protein